MIHRPDILLVAGAGRNVGKSTLVCRLIRKFINLQPVAIKVSPHFHRDVTANTKYLIEEEKDPAGMKDSSRFLRAGAEAVYFIQSHDEHLPEAFRELSGTLPPEMPLIIESGGLAKFVRPGLLIFVEGQHMKKNEDIRQKADLLLQMKQGGFDLSGIGFENGAWKHS